MVEAKKSYVDILCITIHLPPDKLVLLLKLVGVSTQKPQIVGSLGFYNVSSDRTALTQPANHLNGQICVRISVDVCKATHRKVSQDFSNIFGKIRDHRRPVYPSSAHQE